MRAISELMPANFIGWGGSNIQVGRYRQFALRPVEASKQIADAEQRAARIGPDDPDHGRICFTVDVEPVSFRLLFREIRSLPLRHCLLPGRHGIHGAKGDDGLSLRPGYRSPQPQSRAFFQFFGQDGCCGSFRVGQMSRTRHDYSLMQIYFLPGAGAMDRIAARVLRNLARDGQSQRFAGRRMGHPDDSSV